MSAADSGKIIRPTGPRPSDKWIPWYFVGIFIVLAALLGGFAWIAISTNTGVVTDQAYEKGVAYNRTLDAAAAEAALGWKGRLNGNPLPDGKLALAFSLADKDGNPISQARVRAFLVRPTQAGYDFDLTLVGQGEGQYAAVATPPLAGVWAVRVDASADGHDYQISERFVVR